MTYPLSGTTVIECGVAVAGPLATRYLANLGADVIKVDSRGNSGFASAPRWAPKDIGLAGLDLGPGSTLNAEKMSLGLDLKAPEGRAAFARLVASADVFITNLSVPAIESLRITYDDLKAWQPSIIYMGMSGFGTSAGPYRDYRSWGPNLSALSGLDHLTGDPDRPPVMHPNPYPDHVAAFHAVAAVIAALIDRQATGLGRGMEMAQFETAVNILGPQVLAAQRTGESPIRAGNRDPIAAPRGLFPCIGHDRWVAIEVFSDAEWQALLGLGDVPDGLRSPRFASHASRLENADEIEAILSSWTCRFTDREVASRLQACGVAAAPVQRSWDHVTDPQLEARGYWKVVGHDRLGTDLSARLPMLLSETPGRYTLAAPSFGHDTRAVLTDRVGLAETAVEAMLTSGAAQDQAPVPPDIDIASLERPSRGWAWPLLRVFDHTGDEAASGEEADSPGHPPTRIDGCRVLDLSDGLSVYGTRLLTLLGAEVVRVEPPDGSGVRLLPPIVGGEGLFHRYMDAGKKSVQIDHLTSETGRRQFDELIAGADVIYESLRPGQLAKRGFGWDRIHALNPRAVLVSVTPFGQTGPYRDWTAGEVSLWALSGSMPLTGYPDRRPVAPGGGLAASFVGATGAIAAVAGLHARSRTGRGQWIDVSAHEVMVFTAGGMLNQIDDMADRGRNGVRALGTGPYGYYTCEDRLVSLLALMPPHWQSLSAWIYEKTGDEAALDPKYAGSGASRYQHIDEVDVLVNSLARLYGADAFCKEAQARGIPAMPVNAISDVLDDPHLAGAGFWQESLEDGLRWPGPPFRGAGLRGVAPAPGLGQHNSEFLRDSVPD